MIDVRVKTYNYSGGIILLYQNKMEGSVYHEEVRFELANLDLENESLDKGKLFIHLEPNSEKMFSFVVRKHGEEILFRTKMTFYIDTVERNR